MKTINEITACIFQVVSEPGDSTRYEYLVYRDGPDEFTFAPTGNQFNYPQRLNKWLVDLPTDETGEDTLMEIANRFNCNPHTVLECLRTVKQLEEEYPYGY